MTKRFDWIRSYSDQIRSYSGQPKYKNIYTLYEGESKSKGNV